MDWIKGFFAGREFQKGSKIDTVRAVYVIERLLGEGGFGAVYKVHDEKTKAAYAMKVERRPAKPRKEEIKLKMEVKILLKAEECDRPCEHFTKLYDRGSKPQYVFVVMELVGKSIKDMQRSQKNRVFSMSTACQVAEQTLKAIEDLHYLGFIHRDIKPSNLTIGLDEKASLVYLLDFGISRKIINDDGEIKIPREKCIFKGTVKYCSLACHHNREQSGKDDLESWLYLFAEFVHPHGLPWRHLEHTNEVLMRKLKAHTKPDDFFDGFKHREFLVAMMTYMDSLTYVQRIDYDFLHRCVSETCEANGASMFEPLDWEKSINGVSYSSRKSGRAGGESMSRRPSRHSPNKYQAPPSGGRARKEPASGRSEFESRVHFSASRHERAPSRPLIETHDFGNQNLQSS